MAQRRASNWYLLVSYPQFLGFQGVPSNAEYFNVDGSAPAGNYSTGMIGANAVGAFALNDKDLAKECIQKLWDEPLPTGKFRYYSGMVYMMSMLHVSGNFRIIK